MKKHYFLIGTITGLILATGVAYYIMNKLLWSMLFSGENGMLPILVGVATCLILAKLCDKMITSHKFLLRGLILPLLIFWTGAVIGSITNLLVNYDAVYTFDSLFISYVFKPMFWLSLIGLPAAAGLGCVYYLINFGRTKLS